MIKSKAMLTVAVASIFFMAGCSSEETPRLVDDVSSSSTSASPSSSASTPSGTDSKPSDKPSKGTPRTVIVDGKEVEVYEDMTPMPDKDVLTIEEQAEFLKAENERIAKEDEGKPVEAISVESQVESQAVSTYTAYTEALKNKDYKKACSYIYVGEDKTTADCVAHLKTLGDGFNPSFDFDKANSVKMTTSGNVIFQLEKAPIEGTAIPKLTFVERDGKLLLSVPVQ